MAEIDVTVNGNKYRVACEDGEEAHLMSIADHLNAHAKRLADELGQQVHEGLVDILDDTVVVARDVQVDVGKVGRSAAGEAGQGDYLHVVVPRPRGCADDVFGIAG